MRYRTVLVPLDGSELAESALDHAIELARDGAALVLLRAAQAHTAPGADPTDAQVTVVREAEEYLAAVRARLARAGIERVDVSVWYGPPADSIVDAARFRKADLIVMSTHGRSGLGRLIVGSVAETVLRSTTIPILLVRSHEAPVQPVRGGGREASHV